MISYDGINIASKFVCSANVGMAGIMDHITTVTFELKGDPEILNGTWALYKYPHRHYEHLSSPEIGLEIHFFITDKDQVFAHLWRRGITIEEAETLRLYRQGEDDYGPKWLEEHYP